MCVPWVDNHPPYVAPERFFDSGGDLWFPSTVQAKFWGASATGAKFYGARLIGADLRKANLSGAKFEGADLGFVDASDANYEIQEIRQGCRSAAVRPVPLQEALTICTPPSKQDCVTRDIWFHKG